MRLRRRACAWLMLGATAALCGCGPDMNAIANRLRELTITQQREIGSLKDKLAQSEASQKQLQSEVDAKFPPLATLSQERLGELFTAAKIELRNETDSWQMGNEKTLTGFRVFFRTLTENGMNIPATGEVTIEAFELAAAPKPALRLGTWKFTPTQLKADYYAGFGLNQFACNCPWKTPPTSADVTFRLTFRDALTGRVLEAHLDKKVMLPGAAGK